MATASTKQPHAAAFAAGWDSVSDANATQASHLFINMEAIIGMVCEIDFGDKDTARMKARCQRIQAMSGTHYEGVC